MGTDKSLGGLLLSIAYKVSAKTAQNSSLMPPKSHPNFEEKLTFLFEKWHEEFGEI